MWRELYAQFISAENNTYLQTVCKFSFDQSDLTNFAKKYQTGLPTSLWPAVRKMNSDFVFSRPQYSFIEQEFTQKCLDPYGFNMRTAPLRTAAQTRPAPPCADSPSARAFDSRFGSFIAMSKASEFGVTENSTVSIDPTLASLRRRAQGQEADISEALGKQMRENASQVRGVKQHHSENLLHSIMTTTAGQPHPIQLLD